MVSQVGILAPQTPHHVLTGHAGRVRAVAVGELEGRPVVVSGGDDGTVRVWDLATGTPVGDPFTGHTGAVNAVAVGELEGRPVVVSGGDDGTVRVWDLAPGRRSVARSPATPARLMRWRSRSWRAARWRSPAAATARCGCGTWPPGRRSVTRSPATPARLMRWRSRSWRAARWWSPAAATARCGCGTWPPGRPVGDPFTGHTGAVRAVAVGELEGRPVVVSGGDDASGAGVGPGHRRRLVG